MDTKCTKTNCYASSLDDKCLLEKRKIFGICNDYFPKIKGANNELFLYFMHHHNLKARKYSFIAIIISIISIIFVGYSIISLGIQTNNETSALYKIHEAILIIGENINK